MPDMKRKIYYDKKCEELARYFLKDCLGDREEAIKSLAREIQRAVEDWYAGQNAIGREAERCT